MTGDRRQEEDLLARTGRERGGRCEPACAVDIHLESVRAFGIAESIRQRPVGGVLKIGEPWHGDRARLGPCRQAGGELGLRQGDDSSRQIGDGEPGGFGDAFPGETALQSLEGDVRTHHAASVEEPAGKGESHLTGGEEDVVIRCDLGVGRRAPAIPVALPGIKIGSLEGTPFDQLQSLVEEEQGSHRVGRTSFDALYRVGASLGRLEGLSGQSVLIEGSDEKEITVFVADVEGGDRRVQLERLGDRRQRGQPFLEGVAGPDGAPGRDVHQALCRLIEAGDVGAQLAADPLHQILGAEQFDAAPLDIAVGDHRHPEDDERRDKDCGQSDVQRIPRNAVFRRWAAFGCRACHRYDHNPRP